VGTAAAAVAGFLSIRWLLGVISRGRLHYFAYYCWAVGLLALLALLFF
jgi:undecaprenyl-diphosphatase